MKKLYLSLIILASVFYARSQPVMNRATHFRSESVFPFLVNLNNDLFFATETMDSQSPTFGYGYVYKYDAAGNQVFKKPAGPGRPTIGIRSLDNKLVVAAGHNYCDVVTDSSNKYLTKYDASGNTVFSSAYGTLYMDDPKALVQAADSSFLSFTDSLLYRHDKKGVFVLRKNLGVRSIRSAILRPNGNVLISANQGNQPLLAEYSISGVMAFSIATTASLTNLATYGAQQIIANSGSVLYKFSASLAPIGNGALNTGPIFKFIVQSDTVYAIDAPSGLPRYVVADSSCNTIHSSTTTTTHYSPVGIRLVNNKVAIVSSSISKASQSIPTEHYAASLSWLNKFASNNMNHDLELSSTMTDSAYVKQIPNVPNVYHVYHRALCRVKNVGTTPVSRFTLNCYMYPSVACGGFFYQEEFTDVGILQPGDTISVATSTFIQRQVSSLLGGPVPQTYCYFVTMPNGETDKVFEDNEICYSHSFLITDLNSISLSQSEIELFPNPAISEIRIKSSTPIQRLEIYNGLGMMIDQKEIGALETELDCVSWSPGIYFISCTTTGKKEIKKVVKN